MGLGQRIQAMLDKQNKSANWLANEIGVTPSTIYSMIKRDSKKADIEVLLRIANALNVTADELLGNTKRIETIAAHHEDDNYSPEELKEIEQFKAFVKAKRD